MIANVLKYGALAVSIPPALYVGLLLGLTTKWLQTHAVYLHAIQMTWFKDLDVPEHFGFLHNQVSPFRIQSGKSENLYAWHILPIELYRKHEDELLTEPAGFVTDFKSCLAFRLLRDDPQARLIIHFHGAGGTVGSGYRTPNYRALSAGMPEKIHVLTFDYRGFGRTSGTPSEEGIIADALAIVEWAMNEAEIPADRILFFSQSLGTAVNAAVAEHYVQQEPPIVFSGHILVAPFVDVTSLVSTYSIAGTIPLLGPLAQFPAVFDYLRSFVQDSWSTKDRLANYVRENEKHGRPYRLTLIHAEDDYDIPWTHTQALFRHTISATTEKAPQNISDKIAKLKNDHGAAGSVVTWTTPNGIIREEILKYGLHDVIMGNPIITIAVMRIITGSA